jgi:signal transduction histidine kinase
MRVPALLRTSIFQLTLIYMILFGVSVTALSAFIYWSTIGYLERQTDEVIEAELNGLNDQFQQRGMVGLAEAIQDRVRRDTEGRSVYLLVDPTLRKIAGNVDAWPQEFDRVGLVTFNLNTSGNELPVRGRVLGVGLGYRLLVGREIREFERVRQVLRQASIWGLSLTMGLALIGGLLMGLSAQRRIARLNRATRQIIAGDLSQRVPTRGIRDEHEELASNVNAMLDQIEKLLDGLRHVGDSIAHDLRGPLTRLRSRLEMLSAEDPPSKESVAECLDQADALLATFNALLRIARVESGAYRSAFSEIDLTETVRDVCDLYHAAAESRQIDLDCYCEPHGIVFGDRELLAQALTNLLDNAIKYTPAGGHIDVRLNHLGHRIRVTVADSGPGIPAHARDRVLSRFARLDQARSKPGNGLGLTLVRAVAEQHDGTLTLLDNQPGLKVLLELPAAALPVRAASAPSYLTERSA